MNDKERIVYEILNIVVSCCTMEIDGVQTVTAEDVLGPCKKSNVNMTRCIYVTEMLWAGFSTETIAIVLHRTEPTVRHILDAAHQFRVTSRAYRLAEAEATLKCKELLCE